MDWSVVVKVGLPIIGLAFIAEYFDSTIGMGYGTSLTPILLMMGYEPLQIVPSILLSELLTGISAGLMHNKLGNVNLFTPKKIIQKETKISFVSKIRIFLPKHLKISFLIASCSIIGTVLAVILALNLPKLFIKIYIGILILSMGLIILITRNKIFKFSWKKITFLSIIASFNKGISGGGYGPVVTSGQLISGINGKNAIGITSFAEGLTCLVGFSIYLLSTQYIDFCIAPYLIIGGLLSVPLSGLTVKKIKIDKLKILIAIVTIILGLFTLYKIIS